MGRYKGDEPTVSRLSEKSYYFIASVTCVLVSHLYLLLNFSSVKARNMSAWFPRVFPAPGMELGTVSVQ